VRKYFDLIGRRGSELDVNVHEVRNGIIFDGDDFQIESFEVDHDCAAVGYSFIVKEKSRLDRDKLAKMKLPNSPLLGELAKGKVVVIAGKKVDGKKFLYREEGRKVSFVMDTRYNDEIVKAVKGADLLVCESTFSAEESSELLGERAHLSSVEAAKIAKRGKVKGLVLVHLSQRYDGIPKVILGEAKTVFESVVIPEDLESVEL
jgi:ribonuclease Z